MDAAFILSILSSPLMMPLFGITCDFSDGGLNIFSISPDNQIVLFKVVQKSFAGDREEVMQVMKKDGLLTKISSSELLDDYEIGNIVPRVDALTVELIKNKSPRIEHFKGIINC